MITLFSEAGKAVHNPACTQNFTCLLLRQVLPLGIAWGQHLLYALPSDPPAGLTASAAAGIACVPALVCFRHCVNFFFLFIIIRSGLSILMDHPRLYWNNGCMPGRL
jgi:hypothetical protein